MIRSFSIEANVLAALLPQQLMSSSCVIYLIYILPFTHALERRRMVYFASPAEVDRASELQFGSGFGAGSLFFDVYDLFMYLPTYLLTYLRTRSCLATTNN